MTVASRLAAVEASLSPTELVLRWLDEAHAFGSLEAYTRLLVELDPRDYPLNRLCHQAHDGVRAALRGRPAAEVDAAVRRALRSTVFRFELAMRINVVVHDTLGHETLIAALVALRLALLTQAPGPAQLTGTDDSASDVAACLAMLLERMNELRAVEQARQVVEARNLDGRDARFPDLAVRWVETCRWVDDLVNLATRLVELEGRKGLETPEEQSGDAADPWAPGPLSSAATSSSRPASRCLRSSTSRSVPRQPWRAGCAGG